MLNIFIRTTILYIIVIFGLRVMGKRQIGELQPSELVITILISNIASLPMQDISIPLIGGIVPIFTLVSLEIIISVIMVKCNSLRKVVTGKPVFIIKDGEVLQDQMKRVRFTVEDLEENLRKNGVFRLEEVAYAVVETDGQVSVLLKEQHLPVTPEAMNIKVSQETMPVSVITDGFVCKDALNFYGLSESWLFSVLEKENCKQKDIFIMTATADKKYLLIKKSEKHSEIGHSMGPKK